ELAKTYLSLGITYGSCEQLDSALVYFQKTSQLVAKQDSSVLMGGLLNNIGAIYSKKEENNKALEYYRKSLAVFQNEHSQKGTAVSTSNIAYIYKKQGDFTKAIHLYLEAVQLFKETQSLYYLEDSYFNLSEIYEQQNDYKEALRYNNLYLEINDSLTNSDVLGRISDLQMQFEIRKKDQELTLVEQEKELIVQEKMLVEKDNKLSQIRQYLLIGGIVLLLTIGVLGYRNFKIALYNNRLRQQVLKQEKEQLSKNLQYKNKELENFALRIIEKNELLHNLKEKIKTIDTQKPEELDKIKDLSISINNNLYIDEDRREFELRLDKTHQSFFANLDQRFPDLTKNERRLCSLLVLDLSSKDIATILNISPDGVKKSRYRLRKKINLEAETNLSDFLKKV
ncbi:MAG: tetratricopeptide repeat protein, partial [Crocinitomicaceae bacterium]|nr:tetratricopeptide repeat protein [Crocinitomicaceae bacterium]